MYFFLITNIKAKDSFQLPSVTSKITEIQYVKDIKEVNNYLFIRKENIFLINS